MNLFDVYPLEDVTPVKASGCTIWDDKGNAYLDFYGGHAVISIGHSHPHYVASLKEQVEKIGFYPNSVKNPLQGQLARQLGRISGLPSYQLFLCNSGAEANENALKIASMVTGRRKVVCFDRAFHGRTSAAVATTDNPAIGSPLNKQHEVIRLPFNDEAMLEKTLQQETDVAALIIEPIQGIGGVCPASDSFLRTCDSLCRKHGLFFIADEIQCGYGRSGTFFAFQQAGVSPSLITVAKGMGNGFPVGGVLIAPEVAPERGMLGTTYGGNHLACTAALAVLYVLEQEQLMEQANRVGSFLLQELARLPHLKELRGRGLMMGVEFDIPVAPIRHRLLHEKFIFSGFSNTHTLRILPPLSVTELEAEQLVKGLSDLLK